MLDVVADNRNSGRYYFQFKKMNVIVGIFRLKILNEEHEDEFGFIIRLCRDVLLEALLFGDRRRLTKLERGGHRFHQIIENFFKEKPFLRLGLEIYHRF